MYGVLPTTWSSTRTSAPSGSLVTVSVEFLIAIALNRFWAAARSPGSSVVRSKIWNHL